MAENDTLWDQIHPPFAEACSLLKTVAQQAIQTIECQAGADEMKKILRNVDAESLSTFDHFTARHQECPGAVFHAVGIFDGPGAVTVELHPAQPAGFVDTADKPLPRFFSN